MLLNMFYYYMTNKGFEVQNSINETPYIDNDTQKPLKTQNNRTKKVDINILKARVERAQKKENKKNLTIFAFFLGVIGTLGIYLSS